MKFPKFHELKRMQSTELIAKLEELKKQLLKTNAQIGMGTVPENPGSIKPLKKTIAKIEMLLAQPAFQTKAGIQKKQIKEASPYSL